MTEKKPWSFHVCTTCKNTLIEALNTKKAQSWGLSEATEQTAEEVEASARKGCLICAYLNRLARRSVDRKLQRSAQLAALRNKKPSAFAAYQRGSTPATTRNDVPTVPNATSVQTQGYFQSLLARWTGRDEKEQQNSLVPHDFASEQVTKLRQAEQESPQKADLSLRRTFVNFNEPTWDEMESLLAPPSTYTSSGSYTGQGLQSVVQFHFFTPPPDPYLNGFPLNVSATIANETMHEILRIIEWTPMDKLGIQSLDKAYTGSIETMDLAKKWYNCCTREHDVCNQDIDSDWYPTRLVALKNSMAKVIQCDVDKPTGCYACLSYCWGGLRSETFTHETMGKWRAGVPFDKLSTTFHHAMKFVQELGIEYIWIDRFCILQGEDEASVADWNSQSEQMHHIFGNAAITVVAAHASDPSEGCFVVRRLQETRFHALVELDPTRSGTTRLFRVRHQSEPFAGPMENVGSYDATAQRAWCLQESAYSHRIITFGSNGIKWHCAHGLNLTEAKPAFHTVRNSSPKPVAITKSRLGDLSASEVHSIWYNLLRQYTHRELSRPVQDKFKAVGSISKSIQTRLDDGYIFGHFVQSMPKSLCWSSLDEEEECSLSRPSGRILPSWSWAATDGGKSCYPVLTGKGTAIRLATMIFPRDANDLAHMQGEASSIVVLLGKILPVQITRNDGVAVVGTSRWRVYGAVFDIRSEQDYFWKTQSWLYILPVEWLHDESVVQPYLMLLVTQRSNGTFRRVGNVQVSRYNHVTTSGFRWDRIDRIPQATSSDGRMSKGWLEQYLKSKPALIMLT